jgi:hypothetical protein
VKYLFLKNHAVNIAKQNEFAAWLEINPYFPPHPSRECIMGLRYATWQGLMRSKTFLKRCTDSWSDKVTEIISATMAAIPFHIGFLRNINLTIIKYAGTHTGIELNIFITGSSRSKWKLLMAKNKSMSHSGKRTALIMSIN